MIIRDNKRMWAAIIFLLSGALGILILTWPNFENPLFPLLSGLFGISTLLISINDNNKIPEQKFQDDTELDKKVTIKALLSGQFSGFLTAVLPGVSSGIASVISVQITKKLGDHGFMILVGSIGMVNFVLSLLTFHALNKTRNGSIAAIQELIETITLNHIIIFIAASLVAGGIAVLLTLFFGRIFSKYISRVNYKILVISIIMFIALLTIILTGFLGLIFLVLSTAVGLIPGVVKTARVHSMGCLMFPVILFLML
jgi:putative membrane protein